MAVVELHDIGSNQEGVDGASLKNTPTDNGDYYTFNGSDNGLYWGSDWGNETTIDIKAKIRVHDKDKGSEQVFWKSGGSGNGIAIGIDSDGGLGIFGRASSSRTSIEISSSNYSNNVWYYLYATSSGVTLQEVDNPHNYVEQTGTITPGNGTDNESIGFSRTSCPVDGTVADTSYFDGDIDYIELYTAGTLHFTPSEVIFTFSNPIPIPASTVYGTSQTLQLTVTVSGEDPSYVYDASFYNASDDSQIGSTISGTNSGNYVNTIMPTSSGAGYSWYLTATSSGTQDTSQTYSFDNKFLCQGTVEVNGTLTSGIPVRLYLRSDGSYVGGTTSTGVSGTFEIETDHNEYHYAIAIIYPDDETTNAEIFDWLKP